MGHRVAWDGWILTGCISAGLALSGCIEGDYPTAAECKRWADAAGTGYRAAQDQADRSCTADEDCVLVDYELACVAGCGHQSSVARSALPELEAAIESLDSRTCQPHQSRQCQPPVEVRCLVPVGESTAVCEEGECKIKVTR
jgi:hypothetical protein